MGRGSLTFVVLACWAACGGPRYHPPPPEPETPSAIEVAASFDTTWAVAVELLTTRRLPIARMEKAAGIIVAGPIAVHPIDADNWAACGYMTEPVRGRLQFLADRVDFGVLVKPLGDGSAVTVTAHWMTGSHGGGECVSRNVWETGLIRAIKAAAERRSGAELHQEGSKRTPPFTAEPKWQR